LGNGAFGNATGLWEAKMKKTVSGKCEDCGRKFKTTYDPKQYIGSKSPSFYCPDHLVEIEPKWHEYVYGGNKNPLVNFGIR
jgi:hypothetical protein